MFDKEGTLRDWTHKLEGHGGELAPSYCVTDGFKLKPWGTCHAVLGVLENERGLMEGRSRVSASYSS